MMWHKWAGAKSRAGTYFLKESLLHFYQIKYDVQYYLIITLSLGPIELDRVISETVL